MTRFWTAFAVAFVAIFAVTGCNDYGNTFQANTGAQLFFLSPSNATAGGPDLTLTISGNNSTFVATMYATWNEQKLKTTVTTDSNTGAIISVTAVVPAALTAKPGTFFVQTVSPHSGAGYNGLSNPLPFVVSPVPNPVPTISAVAPNTAPAGSTDLSITITGTNFLPASSTTGTSTVNWNAASQMSLTAANITATQITATVPAALLATAGSATITVTNPPASSSCAPGVSCGGNGGGGTSPCPVISVCTFTITDPGNSVNAAALEEETPAVSADGRYVSFAGSQSGHSQIFARDTCQGADATCQPRTILVSAALDGTPGADDSHAPSMSSDGRYVAFSSAALNLSSDSTTATGRQIYLRDTCFGATGSCTASTQLISTDPNGHLVGTEAILPSISGSGRFVAFLAVTPSHAKSAATASRRTAAPNSGLRQIFVRDTCLGVKNCTPATTRLSLQPGDTSNTTKPAGPAISSGADHVALAGGNTSTLFTRSIAVDDGVFLALTRSP